MKFTIKGKTIVDGNVCGCVVASHTALSFWGGVNAQSGLIIDNHHERLGECITNKVLCIPYDRGSCSGSGVMLEMIRLKTAPAAIICIEAEPVLALGSVIGNEVYNRQIIICTVGSVDYVKIKNGDYIEIFEGGKIEVTRD
ncbi:MAG: DUF126 domain-containing protein [Synergistaceae bacterium]|nr:DUF126 domain-containing protein [Synergistaceae bacterium]